MKATILRGDCRERMRELADDSVSAIVCDPPYGLSFMGKAWDYDVPGVDVWREALRVLKPGGHLVAFFGSRTYHRGVVAIEDAGFEIRDQLMWLYGSGFPKSLDVSKAIDKAAGAEREKIVVPLAEIRNPKSINGGHDVDGGDRPWMREARERGFHEKDGDTPATPAAQTWSGWGTALKPAHEPIVLARKPLRNTVAANVLTHGTGAINVDGCRIGSESTRRDTGNAAIWNNAGRMIGGSDAGRWPANVVHDGSAEVTAQFPQSESGANPTKRSGIEYGSSAQGQEECAAPRGAESGSAARFFYSAKADADDRNEGLPSRVRNRHPTVKPVDLMRWLVKLITPSGGLVLDPFMGSGSTGKACALEGFDFVGCELDDEHVKVAEMRIAHAGGLFAQVEMR